ncbi:MAG: hypothetical protein KJZ93_08595 [Caldilineaceae bacterium]|nr:hypothetical protein [Caldilineaceae bacterium]
MQIRIDKFTWVVILIVVALLAAAVVTVNRTSGDNVPPTTYRTADEPATPVYNAFVAMQRGDAATARAQYSQRILAEQAKTNFDPFLNRGYIDGRNARRLRIMETQMDANDPNRALVTIAIDSYYPGGLFSGGSTSTMRRTLQVIREDGVWKLDSDEYFY